MKLKKIAQECGIQKNLTSYVSRHSFAPRALPQKNPFAAISAMLGHSSLKTTQIYLDSLPNETLDEYNALVLSRRKHFGSSHFLLSTYNRQAFQHFFAERNLLSGITYASNPLTK